MKVYAIRWGAFFGGDNMPLFLSREKAEAEKKSIVEYHKKATKEANEFSEEVCTRYKMRDTSDLIEIIELNVEE